MDCNFRSYDLVLLASTLSIYISQGLSSDDIGILAAFFTTVGDNLALIASMPKDEDGNIC